MPGEDSGGNSLPGHLSLGGTLGTGAPDCACGGNDHKGHSQQQLQRRSSKDNERHGSLPSVTGSGSAETAVYWHVNSRGTLLVLTSDTALSEIELPELGELDEVK
ncbi:hypothetical protein GCM10010349_68470 [Streptomyces flavofungini]|nr:hypothetical protein GCM10010349_68470 [Streptomyces flavofungini]